MLNSNMSLIWQPRGNNEVKIHQTLIIETILGLETLNENPDCYVLQPQNIINVTLHRQDRAPIEMGGHEFALIFPKINKYRNGLWIIEPCFIHPNYHGSISIHLCNLSKIPILISVGDRIAEMVTFSTNLPGNSISSHNSDFNDKQYLNDRRSEVFLFPQTFLDVAQNVDRIKKEVGFEPFRNMIILVLTFFTIIVGTAGWVNWSIGRDLRDAIVKQKELEDMDIKEEMIKFIKQEIPHELKKLKDNKTD